MAYTIKLDDEFIGGEELQLMKTKQAILEKLRVRFAEFSNPEGWARPPIADPAISPKKRRDRPRS
jgi:hypothetical protein